MTNMGRLKDLMACEFFQQLKPYELAVVATLFEHRSLRGGDLLFEEGNTNNTMYVIADGTLDLSSRRLGDEAVLHLSRGDVIGEMSLLGETTHLLNAQVVSQSAHVLALNNQQFDQLMQAEIGIARKLLHVVASSLAQRVETMARAQT